MVAKRRAHRQARGFTLVEALIALVIFGLITFALSMSISVALRAQSVSTQRQQDTGEVRAIFGQLGRDLNAAFGSLNSPASVFIAGGSQDGSNATGSGLLTLTTLSHRIEADDLAGGISVAAAQPPQPQSDCALVRYDLDPATGTLARLESVVPDPQAVSQPSDSPANVLSQRVLAFNLRFWDTTNKTWRTDWDFEQQNQPQQTATNTQTGQAGQTDQSGAADSATGDSLLPGAVEVTLALRKSDGTPAIYTTLIPIAAPQPQPRPTTAPTNGAATPNQSGSPNPPANPGG